MSETPIRSIPLVGQLIGEFNHGSLVVRIFGEQKGTQDDPLLLPRPGRFVVEAEDGTGVPKEGRSGLSMAPSPASEIPFWGGEGNVDINTGLTSNFKFTHFGFDSQEQKDEATANLDPGDMLHKVGVYEVGGVSRCVADIRVNRVSVGEIEFYVKKWQSTWPRIDPRIYSLELNGNYHADHNDPTEVHLITRRQERIGYEGGLVKRTPFYGIYTELKTGDDFEAAVPPPADRYPESVEEAWARKHGDGPVYVYLADREIYAEYRTLTPWRTPPADLTPSPPELENVAQQDTLEEVLAIVQNLEASQS